MEEIKEDVEIDAEEIKIKGNLAVPKKARGIVIFAHGSGSSRFSPRNRFVAEYLQKAGFATLLIDLLTEEEESVDEITGEFRFNINLLASRLMYAAHFVRGDERIKNLPVGYFGASTGAGAAIVAAAQLPGRIEAIVSRGGRPDLAEEALRRVDAATLLIVGGEDPQVIELNEWALARLSKAKNKEMVIIPGATHLFEEPGTLEEVADYAKRWFAEYLIP